MDGALHVGSPLSQKPEILAPSRADEVPTNTTALFPNSQCQTLSVVYALLHKILTAAPEQAAKSIMTTA